ncbi:hypothetical protein FI667_g12848, partial [Globisporangium splendens]
MRSCSLRPRSIVDRNWRLQRQFLHKRVCHFPHARTGYDGVRIAARRRTWNHITHPIFLGAVLVGHPASRRSKCRAIESAFRDDLWCKTLDLLACFEFDGCPRGLLHEAITSDAMTQLQSSTSTTVFTIPDTFSTVFAVKYGFRDMASTSFSETTAEADLQTLLLTILSSRAEAVVSMMLSSDSSGYDAVAQISSMYCPNFELHIQVTSVNVPDSADMAWSSELVVDSFN